MPSGSLLPLVALLFLAARPAACQTAWEKADLATRRLAPSAFPALPPSVRSDLEHRGCTVPQVWNAQSPGNVITGHFRTAVGTDWAVLCSVGRVSTVLVYWNGTADTVAELGAAPDRRYLQVVQEDSIGYSRTIRAVDAADVAEHYRTADGARPAVEHQGIGDAFVEKAGQVWFWRQGEWLAVTSGD